MDTYLNLIDGEFVAAADGRTTDIEDPATGTTYAVAPLSGAPDVDAAMHAAARAFGTWSRTTPSERAMSLLRLADAVEARADELVAREVRDTGKPLAITRDGEMPSMIDQIRFFAGAARLLEGKSAGEYLPGYTSWLRREPVGVCAQVAPWNYPLMMGIWKLAPAIAAGNTVVLKPSDTTPASTALLAEIATEVLPPGVLNVICGDADTGRAMVSHRIPSMASITGSVRAGMEVATSAAATLKRVHLELGGKAPVLVFDDADLEAAVENIANSGYFNAGQDCTAATRVLASGRVYDDFVAALTERATATRTGAPSEEAFFGPINNPGQLAHVAGLVGRAPDHAEVTTGGTRVEREGYFFLPTVVAGVRQDDELSQREIFGPVVTVQPFRDEDEAVAWANGVDYGLAASVWTTNLGRALRMTQRLDFGCVWVNAHSPTPTEMPHGGFKHSGYGKDLSAYALDDYTRVKHVMANMAG